MNHRFNPPALNTVTLPVFATTPSQPVVNYDHFASFLRDVMDANLPGAIVDLNHLPGENLFDKCKIATEQLMTRLKCKVIVLEVPFEDSKPDDLLVLLKPTSYELLGVFGQEAVYRPTDELDSPQKWIGFRDFIDNRGKGAAWIESAHVPGETYLAKRNSICQGLGDLTGCHILAEEFVAGIFLVKIGLSADLTKDPFGDRFAEYEGDGDHFEVERTVKSVDWAQLAIFLDARPNRWVRVPLASITGSSNEDKRSNLRASITRRIEGKLVTEIRGKDLFMRHSPSSNTLTPIPGRDEPELTMRDLENRTYKILGMGTLRNRQITMRLMRTVLELKTVCPNLPDTAIMAMAIDGEYLIKNVTDESYEVVKSDKSDDDLL